MTQPLPGQGEERWEIGVCPNCGSHDRVYGNDGFGPAWDCKACGASFHHKRKVEVIPASTTTELREKLVAMQKDRDWWMGIADGLKVSGEAAESQANSYREERDFVLGCLRILDTAYDRATVEPFSWVSDRVPRLIRFGFSPADKPDTKDRRVDDPNDWPDP